MGVLGENGGTGHKTKQALTLLIHKSRTTGENQTQTSIIKKLESQTVITMEKQESS